MSERKAKQAERAEQQRERRIRRKLKDTGRYSPHMAAAMTRLFGKEEG